MDVACQGGVLSDLVVDNGFSVGVIGLGGGIGRASGVGYLDVGLVLGLLRGSLPLGAGLGRGAFGGGALVLVGGVRGAGCSWARWALWWGGSLYGWGQFWAAGHLYAMGTLLWLISDSTFERPFFFLFNVILLVVFTMQRDILVSTGELRF